VPDPPDRLEHVIFELSYTTNGYEGYMDQVIVEIVSPP